MEGDTEDPLPREPLGEEAGPVKVETKRSAMGVRVAREGKSGEAGVVGADGVDECREGEMGKEGEDGRRSLAPPAPTPTGPPTRTADDVEEEPDKASREPGSSTMSHSAPNPSELPACAR